MDMADGIRSQDLGHFYLTYYAFNSPHGYHYPFWRWGSQGWYGNGNLYGYDINNNYMDNTNVSYNRGRRGSANVVVYSDGRSSSSNTENPERVRNYNNTRETLNNIANSRTNLNSNTRSYRSQKIQNEWVPKTRNYINSGLIVNDNGNNSPKSSPSRRGQE